MVLIQAPVGISYKFLGITFLFFKKGKEDEAVSCYPLLFHFFMPFRNTLAVT